MIETGAWLAAIPAVFALLLDVINDGMQQMIVYAVFILLFVCIFMFINSFFEELSGEDLPTYVRRRRSVPKQHRGRIR